MNELIEMALTPALIERPLARLEMTKAASLLFEPDQIVELRAFQQNGKWQNTFSGYFKDKNKLVDASMEIYGKKGVEGIYVTLNDVDEGLYARRADRFEEIGPKGSTTTDKDILRRRWLFLDIDAGQASGTSSSDKELIYALRLAGHIRKTLASNGWPSPIFAASGNGAHLLYRIDLPAEDGGIIKNVLAALDGATKGLFGKAHIDTAVFNPARLCKLWGSTARKGDSISGRPHRSSRILSVPDSIQIVPTELLEAMSAQAQKQKPKTAAPSTKNEPRQQARAGRGVAETEGSTLDIFGVSPWARAALEGELGRVRAAVEGERNVTLNAAAFALGQIVGGGGLDRTKVEAELESAAAACGLDASEARKAIRSGLDKGEQSPRQEPPPKRKSTTRAAVDAMGPGLLEKAVTAMGEECDGATSNDKRGFGKVCFSA